MKIYSNGKTLEVSSCASQNIYSTEEQVIGRWIDGKPLYRKVFVTKTPANQANNISIISTSDIPIDYLVSNRGFVAVDRDSENANAYSILPIPFLNTDHTITVDWNIEAGIRMNFKTSYLSILGDQPLIIIAEYTKTTDQATIELPAALTAAPAQAPFTAAPQSAAAVTLDARIKNKEV